MEELSNDQKELAEHLILIDLGWHGLGQISEAGSVNLTVRMRVERCSYFTHIVSNLSGVFRDGVEPIEALRPDLPAGLFEGGTKASSAGNCR